MILENQIFTILINEMDLWATRFNSDYGILIPIERSFNTEMANVPADMTCYLFSMDANPYGAQSRGYTEDDAVIDATPKQIFTHPFQVKILEVSQPIAGDDGIFRPSSYDAAVMLSMWMQTPESIERLFQFGIGIQKIPMVTNHKPLNNSDQFQPEPTFDITLNYTQSFDYTSARIDDIIGEVYSTETLP